MSLLQTTAEEGKQSAYRSAPSDATSTGTISPTSATTNAASLEDISITARQVRPDELMAALAAIDARKTDTVVGTLPLGDVLERLQADVTPEEVWQEVYVRRLQQRKSGVTTPSANTLRRRKRFWAIGGGLAGLFAVAIVLRLLVGDVVGAHEAHSTTRPIAAIKPPPLNQQFLQEPFQRRSPNTLSLAQLQRENRMLRLDLGFISDINVLLHGNSFLLPMPRAELEKVKILLSEGAQGDWLTHFPEGGIYLRGWIEMSPEADQVQMLAQKVSIYNRPDNPALTGKTIRQITVPVDGIKNYKAISDGVHHVIEGFLRHLDGEAWKPWETPPLPNYSGIISHRSASEL